MAGRRARMTVAAVEMYLITVDIDGKYITKPVDEYVVDLINEVQTLKESVSKLKKMVRDIDEKVDRTYPNVQMR